MNQNDINDVILLLLTVNRFRTLFWCFIDDFAQVNVGWDGILKNKSRSFMADHISLTLNSLKASSPIFAFDIKWIYVN